MENQNYSFYLFCNLREVVMPSQESYDTQFENDVELYNAYLKSDESTCEMSEYDAMLLFLNNKSFSYYLDSLEKLHP